MARRVRHFLFKTLVFGLLPTFVFLPTQDIFACAPTYRVPTVLGSDDPMLANYSKHIGDVIDKIMDPLNAGDYLTSHWYVHSVWPAVDDDELSFAGSKIPDVAKAYDEFRDQSIITYRDYNRAIADVVKDPFGVTLAYRPPNILGSELQPYSVPYHQLFILEKTAAYP